MSDQESVVEAYDIDKAYAPVGLFVLTFWMSALVMGLFGFGITLVTSTGLATVVKNEEHGIFDGLVSFGLLFVLSVLISLAGRGAVISGKSIDGLWKLAYLGIPALMLVISFVAIMVNH